MRSHGAETELFVLFSRLLEFVGKLRPQRFLVVGFKRSFVREREFLPAAAYLLVRGGCQRVKLGYIPFPSRRNDSAVLCKLRVPHGQHIVRSGCFVRFFEQIVFLFQHFIVSR